MEVISDAMEHSTPRGSQSSDGFRTCIASGQRKLRDQMLRFVIGPDSSAVPDLDEILPGRGLWLSAERNALHVACTKNLFAKRVRYPVRLTMDLAQRVDGLLADRCVALLQLARRSGVLSAGSDEVRRRLSMGGKGVLVLAADGAPKSLAKIINFAGDVTIWAPLSSDELGAVLGRIRLVSVFVDKGGLADRLARDLSRLSGLRNKTEAV